MLERRPGHGRDPRRIRGAGISLVMIAGLMGGVGGCSSGESKVPSLVNQQASAEADAHEYSEYIKRRRPKENRKPDVVYEEKPVRNDAGTEIGRVRELSRIFSSKSTLTETHFGVSENMRVFSVSARTRVYGEGMTVRKEETCVVKRTGTYEFGEWEYTVTNGVDEDTATIGEGDPRRTQQVIDATKACLNRSQIIFENVS